MHTRERPKASAAKLPVPLPAYLHHRHEDSETPLTPPEALFLAAQKTWTQRAVPTFEAFTIPCADTIAKQCNPGEDARIVVRLADGKYFANALNPDGSTGRMLLRGQDIAGPAGAPFGFYRRAPQGTAPEPPPAFLAPDPMQTIATVEAVDRAYDIRLIGTEQVFGYETDHLSLVPLREPNLYPLRDLWIDRKSHQVVRLTYQQPYRDTGATIQYDFAPAGTPSRWMIVHISATAGHESVSQELRDIEFPASEPGGNFGPGAP